MHIYLNALTLSLLFAALGWLYSLFRSNVNIVDTMWSLFFIINALCFVNLDSMSFNQTLVIGLIIIWGLRLSAYLIYRNANKPEDSRYQDIRRNYSPNFAFKSLLIIFIFQAILALILSYPLYYIFNPIADNSGLLQSYTSYMMIAAGIVYETIADLQLVEHKKNRSRNEVCKTGLWKFSRHPNYFGELLITWGVFVNAIAYTHIYILISPLIMTYFLFKFSGAGLMEETIIKRKPKYKDYIRSTNTIFPWPPKK
jgi:steroid 5-alpha reductase family enzyme